LKGISQILVILFILITLGFAKLFVPLTKKSFKERKKKEMTLFFSKSDYQLISSQPEFEENEFIFKSKNEK